MNKWLSMARGPLSLSLVSYSLIEILTENKERNLWQRWRERLLLRVSAKCGYIFCVSITPVIRYPGTLSFFSLTNECEAKRENLWAHTLGPLNAPIQSEAVFNVSESDFDSETSITTSDWIGTFKGPNVCAQRFSHVSSLLQSLPHARSWPRKPLGTRIVIRLMWSFLLVQLPTTKSPTSSDHAQFKRKRTFKSPI